jgi:hypothetical protein
MANQTIQQLTERIHLFLDNGLSKAEENELLLEIQSNPAYLQILSKEKSFREFLKSRLQRRKPSPALVQSIKEKIKTTRDFRMGH